MSQGLIGLSAPIPHAAEEWTLRDRCTAILLIVLCFYVATCAVWIDVQNRLAGHPLPRESKNVNPKWRIAAFDDTSWSDDEKRQRYWERSLRDWIESHGLLQYLICPATVFIGFRYLSATKFRLAIRRLGKVAVVIAVLGLLCAFRLKYLSSLGW